VILKFIFKYVHQNYLQCIIVVKILTKGLMTIMIQELKSISIVEDEGFRKFIHIDVPEYIVPYKMTIIKEIDQMAIFENFI